MDKKKELEKKAPVEEWLISASKDVEKLLWEEELKKEKELHDAVRWFFKEHGIDI